MFLLLGDMLLSITKAKTLVEHFKSFLVTHQEHKDILQFFFFFILSACFFHSYVYKACMIYACSFDAQKYELWYSMWLECIWCELWPVFKHEWRKYIVAYVFQVLTLLTMGWGEHRTEENLEYRAVIKIRCRWRQIFF